jgi:hypothetical protein
MPDMAIDTMSIMAMLEPILIMASSQEIVTETRMAGTGNCLEVDIYLRGALVIS